MTTTAKTCVKCGGQLESNRKKFCCDSCKWWYNSIKKENEKHLPPVKKRNKDWCHVYVSIGNTISHRGQGKRSGGMVKGSMSANVSYQITELRPFNFENMNFHFSKKGSGFIPNHIWLGDGTMLTKDEAETFLINQDTERYAAH
jgi:hypothetical protein